jgi:hypothetical protein
MVIPAAMIATMAIIARPAPKAAATAEDDRKQQKRPLEHFKRLFLHEFFSLIFRLRKASLQNANTKLFIPDSLNICRGLTAAQKTNILLFLSGGKSRVLAGIGRISGQLKENNKYATLGRMQRCKE